MTVTGIICEYNPLHLGHQRQLDAIRALNGKSSGIVCLMSGNFVQRGAPAIIDKSLRAKAAVLSGADLVLELPVTAALSSAEGFAAQGVGILGGFCDYLCFGSESGSAEALTSTAQALLSADFSPVLREYLEKGLSFPAARQGALEAMGMDASCLSAPNDILAVEYCKAILAQNTNMKPLPIRRGGSYHDTAADPENPSATAVRGLMVSGQDWGSYVPEAARSIFSGAAVHTLSAGERAVLAVLRSMAEDQFAALPYGSEGLWRKLMHTCRKKSTLEEIASEVKSKRYTRSRIDRMILCAFLGITEEMVASPAPYCRVLAFNDRGRAILKKAKEAVPILNAGEPSDDPYWELEKRWGGLYGLFAENHPDVPNSEENRRIYYHKETKSN